MKLKSIREEQGLKQTDLAISLNTTQATISRYESGESEPDIATLQKLCSILNCTFEDLVNGSDREGAV